MLEKIKYFLFRFSSSRRICLIAMSLLLAAVITFLTASINIVKIHESGSVKTIYSLKNQPTELMSLAGYNAEGFEITDVKNEGKLINISLSRTFPVHITLGEQTNTVNVIAGTSVADAIKLAGISLDQHDIVNLPLLNQLTGTTYIDVIDISYVTVVVEETIPYSTKTVYSNKYDTTFSTGGSEGLKNVTYLKKVVNGEELESTFVSQDIVKSAVDKVVTVGTKAKAVTDSSMVNCISTLKPSKPIELDKNGNPTTYKKHITVQATAYTYTGYNCAWGVAPQPGYVAINTNIFPYGTKFYIKSSDGRYIYGYAVAADTGGFVETRPNNFDLFFETEAQCRAFGRRNIEVYVLY